MGVLKAGSALAWVEGRGDEVPDGLRSWRTDTSWARNLVSTERLVGWRG